MSFFFLGPNDFDDFEYVVQRMTDTISAITDDRRETTNFTSGRTVDTVYERDWNIFFVFDASKSVGKQYFKKGIKFAKAIVSKVGINGHSEKCGGSLVSG